MIRRALSWLHDFALWLPLHIFKLLCDGLAALINFIPAPGFFSSAAGWIGAIPGPVAYLLSSLQIGTGVTILVTAYTLRFLIRRIPFIG
jgi:hypothetical protein